MRIPLTSFLIAGAVCVFAACSSDRDTFDDSPASFATTEAGAADSSCESRCSRDLKSVVRDCDGATVTTCAAGEACGDGKCIDACAATALSKGSIGCSFWALPPDPYRVDIQGSCYAAIVANSWSEPLQIGGELGTEKLDLSKAVYKVSLGEGGEATYTRLDGAIPPGEVAVVFLMGRQARPEEIGVPGDSTKLFVGCPADVQAAVAVDVTAHGTGLSKAFHLTSSLPISAYSMFPYGGFKSYIPSATLLLPEPALADNYVMVTAWKATDGDTAKLSRPYVQVVATQDDTEVRIRPSVDIADGPGVVGGATGAVTKFVLARGQALQLSQIGDLLGSAMESSKPVAVFGGNTCFNIPDGYGFCDSAQQQIPPLSQWGRRYAGVPYRSRLGFLLGSSTERAPESVPYRIVGAVADTALVYHPRKPLGAPSVIGPGEVVSFDSSEVFSVESKDADHPFYMAVYMTGSTFVGTNGDPEFLNVVPVEQYLDDYRFFVDFTFADSALTFVRRRERGVFSDVTLDCKGVLTGWMPVDGDPDLEYLWLDVSLNAVPVAPCGYGPQHAHSDGPFTAVVWGWGKDSSYGYPAGAGSRPLSATTIEVR